ncbi:hypothetical protein [Streptomyces xanthochromogenes]
MSIFMFTKKQRDEAFARVGREKVAGLKPDRFEIKVSENLTGPGGPFSSRRRGPRFNYRVVVTDTQTGIPQHAAPQLTYESAHRAGRIYVQKLCDEKKRLKVA